MPFDLRDLAFEEEAARKMELLHFAVDCRVFFGGDEGQEVLADRLENGVLSEQIEVLPTLGGLPVDDRAQVVECLWGFVLEAAVYFFEVFAEIQVVDGDIVFELDEVAIVEGVHGFEVVSLVYFVAQYNFEVVLDGLEEIAEVDVFEAFLPDGALEVLFAEDVHFEPQLIGVGGVAEDDVEEADACFLLLVSLLLLLVSLLLLLVSLPLVGIFPLCLVLYTNLHIQPVEILHAPSCQLGLQYLPEPADFGQPVYLAQVRHVQSERMHHLAQLLAVDEVLLLLLYCFQQQLDLMFDEVSHLRGFYGLLFLPENFKFHCFIAYQLWPQLELLASCLGTLIGQKVMESLQEEYLSHIFVHEDSLGLIGHNFTLGLVEQYLWTHPRVLYEFIEIEMTVEELILKERLGTVDPCFEAPCESLVLENDHERNKQVAFVFGGFEQVIIIFHLPDGSEFFLVFFLDAVLIVEVDFYVDIFDVVVGEISVDLVLGEDLVGIGDVDFIYDGAHYFLGVLPEVENEFGGLLVGDDVFDPISAAAVNIVFDLLLRVN